MVAFLEHVKENYMFNPTTSIKKLFPQTFQALFSIAGLENAIVFEAPTDSGLANQLRGLTSAMLMAEETGRNFYLHWGDILDMPGLGGFSELFDDPVLPSTTVTGESLSRLQRLFCMHRGRGVLPRQEWVIHELRPHHQFNSILCDMIAGRVNFAFPAIVLSTYYSFHADPVDGIDFYRKRHQIYERFVPARDIREKYRRFIDRYFNEHTIGVHIRTRKTNKRLTKEWDSHPAGPIGQTRLDLFSLFIDEEIEKNPDAQIFLATDNTKECRSLMEKYKDRLFMYPKETTAGMVNRFSLADHQDALIDLYLLANTRKIIGTKQSSFSYEAAVIGDTPFVELSGRGLRQEYFLVKDKKVIIDFRDNGIGAFTKEMIYDGRKSSSYRVCDVQGKSLIEFFYNELRQIDRPVVCDVGASTGCFSLVAKFLPGSTFYACEPNEMLFDVLKSNLVLNNLEQEVRAFNRGLSDETGETLLYVPGKGGYLAGTYSPHAPAAGPCNTVPTMAETLDHFVGRQDIRKMDFLKVHTGGSEYAIVKGGRATLKRLRPKLLIRVSDTALRSFGQDKKGLLDLLDALRYRYTFIESEWAYCVPHD